MIYVYINIHMLNIIINASNASRFFSYPVRFTSLSFSLLFFSHVSVERLLLCRARTLFPSLSFTSCCNIAIRHSRARSWTHTYTHTLYIICTCKIIHTLTRPHTCSTWLDNHLKFSLPSLNKRIVNSFFFFFFFFFFL